jgi:hypothetical protein
LMRSGIGRSTFTRTRSMSLLISICE